MNPLRCSILIPTYKSPLDYFSAAIQSAIMQTVPTEVCICGDGCEPDRADFVAEVIDRAGFTGAVKYEWQPNAGVAAALNTCLSMATCDWVAWLPADDLYRADHIETMLSELDFKSNELLWRIAYSSYEEGVPIVQARWPAAQFSSRESLFAALQQGCFINAASVVWHRSVFDDLGGWDPALVHAQDAEFIMRCAEVHPFLAVHHYGVRRRLHPGQMVRTLHDPAERAKKKADMVFLKDRYGAWLPREPETE